MDGTEWSDFNGDDADAASSIPAPPKTPKSTNTTHPAVNYGNVTVVFSDAQGRKLGTAPFTKCYTANKLFDKACEVEAAEPDTRLLKIFLGDRFHNGESGWMRMVKDDQDSFEEKLMTPLRNMLRKGQGARGRQTSIPITVRKFM